MPFNSAPSATDALHPASIFMTTTQSSEIFSQSIKWTALTSWGRPDPNGILAFLVQELQATEDAGQRAWVLGHIPFGSGDYLHDQVRMKWSHRNFPW